MSKDAVGALVAYTSVLLAAGVGIWVMLRGNARSRTALNSANENTKSISTNTLNMHELQAKAEEITFLSEQDGPTERLLKDSLVPVLKSHVDTQSAYLCSIMYSDSIVHIALCLRIDGDHRPVARDAASVFSKIFNSAEHMDILIVSPRQEAEIVCVCAPFYKRGY